MFENTKQSSNFIKLLLTVVFCLSLFSCEKLKFKEYTVEFTYCDGRPKKTKIVEQQWKPSNNDIMTYKRAVPECYDELNVCELRVVK